MSGFLVVDRPERGELRRFLVAGAVTLVLHGAIFLAIELSPGTVPDATPVVAISVGFTEVRSASPTTSANTSLGEPDTVRRPENAGDGTVAPDAAPDEAAPDTLALDATSEVALPDLATPDTAPQPPTDPVETMPDETLSTEIVPPVTLPARTIPEHTGGGAGNLVGDPARASGGTGSPTPVYDSISPQRRYVEPQYPPAARQAGIEGAVVVSFLIDRRGRPRDVEIIEGSGHAVLDREVLRAVQLWRFSRDEAGRTPVHRVEFRLKEDS